MDFNAKRKWLPKFFFELSKNECCKLGFGRSKALKNRFTFVKKKLSQSNEYISLTVGTVLGESVVCPQNHDTHQFTEGIINFISYSECSRSQINDDVRCPSVRTKIKPIIIKTKRLLRNYRFKANM